jgi:hypothetical protein
VRVLVIVLALNSIAGNLLFTHKGIAGLPSPSKTFRIEFRRGCNAAAYAMNDCSRSDKWFQQLMLALDTGEVNHTNSQAFLMGAYFGFSYGIGQLERSGSEPRSKDLRNLMIQSTIARLKYEERKRMLGITDAQIVTVLDIPILPFIAWKASTETTDNDATVVDTRRWLQL